MVWYKPWTWSIFESNTSVVVEPSHREHDVKRSYNIESVRDGAWGHYEYPLTPPVHGFDTLHINLDNLSDMYDPDEEFEEFVWSLCMIELHELTHKYEDGPKTTDPNHALRWAKTFVACLDPSGFEVDVSD